MKFGGTSVGDPDAIARLISIVRRQLVSDTSPAPVVVVSALSKVTDGLIEATRLAADGNGNQAAAKLQALRERHLSVAAAVTNNRCDAVLAIIRAEFDELIGLVHALSVLREVSPRSLDAVVAIGEVLSSRMIAAALQKDGIAAVCVDARRVLVTDAE